MREGRRRLRPLLWGIILTIGILIDEYLKEGYFIKPSDFLKFPTHESLIEVTIIASVLAYIYLKKRDR